MRILVVVALLGALAVPVQAQTQSVYGPDVPGNSAFVRFVNAIAGTAQQSFELGATSFSPLAYAGVSPYKPVTPDIYQLDIAGQQQEVIPQSGAYYTVVCSEKEILVLEDPPHVDPARAQLFLYNLSSLASVDLKTSDGKTVVIAGVKANASGMKVVNAVAVTLPVWNGSTRVAAVGNLGLARGSSFSVFVLGEGSSPKVFAVKAAVAQ